MLYIIQSVIMKALWDPGARLLSLSRIHERAGVKRWRREGRWRERQITQRKGKCRSRESEFIKMQFKRQGRNLFLRTQTQARR